MSLQYSFSEIEPAPTNTKYKFQVHVTLHTPSGDITKLVKFGDKNYQDFTQHGDLDRRRNYLARSAGIRDKDGNLTKNNPFSANYWSRRVLWASND